MKDFPPSRSIGRRDCGAAVVEFVLIFSLLLVFIFGIVEFGFLWLESNHIANAAREGARVASRTADADLRDDAAEQAVKDYLVTFTPFANNIDTEGFLSVTYTESALTDTDGTEIDGVDQAKVEVTVDTSMVWDPVLWSLLELLPFFSSNDYPDDYLTTMTQSATFAVQD